MKYWGVLKIYLKNSHVEPKKYAANHYASYDDIAPAKRPIGEACI
jgi:hypothetical protein